MRVVAVSDTHGARPQLPDGDLLVHAGDSCLQGTELEFRRFCEWLGAQPHEYKVAVPGNHDRWVEREPEEAKKMADSYGFTLLIDGALEVEGKKLYGSAWTPRFGGWAFMYPPPKAYETWARVPSGLDLLITHGPPYGVLDECPLSVGCPELAGRIEVVQPRFHVFGHIHEQGGKAVGNSFNVSYVTERYAVDPSRVVRTFEL